MFNKSAIVPHPEGPHLTSISSGSAAWDVGLGIFQGVQTADYGRTVSISADPQASINDCAVISFITGALYDKLAAAGEADPSNPAWFLRGDVDASEPVRLFGTPYIPDSSMSLGEGTATAEQIDAAAGQEVLNSTVTIGTIIPGANNAAAYLSRQPSFAKTTLQNWEDTIAAQSSGSSSGYWPPSPP